MADFFNCTFSNKLAFIQNSDMGTDFLYFQKVMGRKKYRDSLVIALTKNLPDLPDSNRVKAVCGFIKDQYFWIIQKSLRNSQSCFHTMGKIAHPFENFIAKSNLVQ